MVNDQFLIYIFLQLENLQDMYKFMLCCKKFYNVTNTPSVCKKIYKKLFITDCCLPTCKKRINGIVNWKC